jgi:endonuclease YncB( thermonuclease family)
MIDPMPDLPATYDYAATDCRVVDGDTVEVTLVKATDVGFGVLVTAQLPRTRLRLAGLDAKPLHTPQGDAATQWLHDQVLAIGGRCNGLRIRTVKNAMGDDKHEKYGRYLVFVYEAGVTPSLNETMVAAGLAVAWDGRGKKPE